MWLYDYRLNWSTACSSPVVFLICHVGFQDIGYKGEIGYQTFLYSNEPEIRSLLMCLVEKLPRESAEVSDQPTGTQNTSLSVIHKVSYHLSSERKKEKCYMYWTILLHLLSYLCHNVRCTVYQTEYVLYRQDMTVDRESHKNVVSTVNRPAVYFYQFLKGKTGLLMGFAGNH